MLRPELPERRRVVGAVEIGAGEHDEERCRIDAAVVAAERHLAESGHLAVAHLVQDLAGLGIGDGIRRCRLVCGEIEQHAARERRIGP